MKGYIDPSIERDLDEAMAKLDKHLPALRSAFAGRDEAARLEKVVAGNDIVDFLSMVGDLLDVEGVDVEGRSDIRRDLNAAWNSYGDFARAWEDLNDRLTYARSGTWIDDGYGGGFEV